MIPADLLEMLRCPVTHQTLAVAEPAVLAGVNARLPNDAKPLDAALIRADRAAAFPVVDGIPVLLPDSLILL